MSREDERAAARVILEQLAALRAGDFARAYGFAAQEIRALFDLEAFTRMVRDGYAALGASTSAEISDVRVRDDAAAVRVTGVAHGQPFSARYEMLREEEGWRVAGVTLQATLTATVSMNGHRSFNPG
jgi:hypothetical protein